MARPLRLDLGAGSGGGLGSVAVPFDVGPFDAGPLAAPPKPLPGLGQAAAVRPFDLGPLDLEAPPERPKVRARSTGGLGAAAAASAPPPVAPGAPPSALQRALAERDGEIDAIYKELENEKFRTVTTANPLFPIVQEQAQTFYGGGPLELQPFTPPPPEAGEDEWSYMQRVQALQDEDVQRQLAEAQTLGDVRDIGRSGHLGMREAQIQAAEGVGEAEVAQQERVAETMRQTAELSAKATAEARAADQERRDFALAQRDAIAQAQAVQADAREKLQALPELDANRTFKSMDGGGIFWAILGSLAGGAIGANQVPGQLMELAARDLETQKANAAQAFDAAAVADAGVAQQTGLYRELLDAAGDEAAADAMFLQLQLEDAERMLQAQLAETTVPALRAQIQESMVGLRQQIDAQQRAIDVATATTPKNFTRTVGSLGPRTRKKLEERALRLEKERTDFQKLGVASEEAALTREADAAAKKADAEIKAARGEGGYQREAWDYAQKAAPYVAVNSSLSTITKRFQGQDIPGRGLASYFWSEDGRALREDIKETMRRQLRSESGAVLGEDELEDRFDSTYSGLGDAELLSNLERLRNANARYVQSLKAGISDEAAQFYDSNLERRGGISGSVQAVGGTPQEDAARLGGRLVE